MHCIRAMSLISWNDLNGTANENFLCAGCFIAYRLCKCLFTNYKSVADETIQKNPGRASGFCFMKRFVLIICFGFQFGFRYIMAAAFIIDPVIFWVVVYVYGLSVRAHLIFMFFVGNRRFAFGGYFGSFVTYFFSAFFNGLTGLFYSRSLILSVNGYRQTQH